MTEPIEEPLSHYSKIVQNLDNIARKHGLYIQGAALPIRDEDGPVFLQVTFLVGEVAVEVLPQETEDPELLAQFEDIISGGAKAETEQKVEQIRREYLSGDGIFGPLDDE